MDSPLDRLVNCHIQIVRTWYICTRIYNTARQVLVFRGVRRLPHEYIDRYVYISWTIGISDGERNLIWNIRLYLLGYT